MDMWRAKSRVFDPTCVAESEDEEVEEDDSMRNPWMTTNVSISHKLIVTYRSASPISYVPSRVKTQGVYKIISDRFFSEIKLKDLVFPVPTVNSRRSSSDPLVALWEIDLYDYLPIT